MKNTKKSRTLPIIALSVAAVFILAVTALIYVVLFSPEAVEFDPQKLISVNGGFGVYDVNGKPIPESIPIRSARKTSLQSLPEYVKNAFIAVEDKRFYRHDGVDPVRIVGAIKNNIFSGRFKEGASTITQQLVKNVYLSGKKNFSRKINEIRLAREVEKHYSKDEILEIYLNTIYFGSNAYGIEAAAQTYFDKSARNLTVPEAAALAGMIKAPTAYSPANDPEKCEKRRNIVLFLMRDQNYITEEEYVAAKNSHIDLLLINRNRSFYKRYMHGAVQEACEILGITEKQLGESRLMIYTYYDEKAQKVLQNAVEESDIKTSDGKPAQTCGMILDNKTFGITAFSGFGRNNFYLMKRNAGSCVKPLAVYAPALNERLITPATPINDVRRTFGNYSPRNYGNKYYGRVTIREAVTRSLNSPAVFLMNQLTPSLSRKYLSDFGIKTDKKDENLSLALGSFTYGITLKELTEAYATLANGGKHSKAAFIRKITDENGNILYVRKPVSNRAIDEDSAFLITDMLISVAKKGTAKTLCGLDFQIAAKTGTVGASDSDENTDALIAAYTTRNTLTVWTGGYSGDPLPSSVTGGSAPANIMKNILERLYQKDSLPENFVKPDSVTKLKVVIDSDKEGENPVIASENDANAFVEYFSLKNLPKEKTEIYSPQIDDFSVGIVEGYPSITVSGNAQIFEIHRIKNGRDVVIAKLCGNEAVFSDYDTEKGKTYVYYVIPICGDRKGKASEKIEVTLPSAQNEPDEPPDEKWWEWTGL